MDNINIIKIGKMAQMLCKKITGTANEKEMKEIEQWLTSDPRREKYFSQLDNTDFLKEEARQRAAIDIDAAEEKMRLRIGEMDSAGNATALNPEEKVPMTISFMSRMMRYAGIAAVFLLFAGVTMWYWQRSEVTPPTLSQDEQIAMTRTMQNDEKKVEVVEASEKVKVLTKKELMEYNVDEEFAEALENGRKVTTFTDKEYWTTLDDGTVVHLSPSSRLVYPERFGSGQRDVILDGEAYFMVAQDKRRPFIVHTPDGDITEYGTKFHVNTRINGKRTEVVLVSGSISITGADRQERMMKPGQRAVMGEDISIETIDTSPYVAWHTGKYTFRDVTLESIMKVLDHWYGYDTEYAYESMKDVRLSGSFDKFEDIETQLESIETVTGLTITRKADKILVDK